MIIVFKISVRFFFLACFCPMKSEQLLIELFHVFLPQRLTETRQSSWSVCINIALANQHLTTYQQPGFVPSVRRQPCHEITTYFQQTSHRGVKYANDITAFFPDTSSGKRIAVAHLCSCNSRLWWSIRCNTLSHHLIPCRAALEAHCPVD